MGGRLTAEEWTERALQVAAEEGIEAVRIEPLAVALGVTKGSFYWHFKDRRALLDALLIAWERVATEEVIAKVESDAGTPAEQLRRLILVVFRHGAALDRAVRAWSAHDAAAAKAISRVDATRYRFVRRLFEVHGLAADVAAIRARLLYTALIGEQHTSLRLGRERRVEWALANLELLLGQSETLSTHGTVWNTP